ncbi:MAG: M20/M25/M40 family metallo-hydrolase [Candidatus Omnitrophica bacterium]|nr:M20/M25/M40 family metallo-hydrolase [Candidatus Omnitrophota bacterium]
MRAKRSLLNKYISIVVACVFLWANSLNSAEFKGKAFSPAPAETLSADSSFSPIVDIKKTRSGFVIVENKDTERTGLLNADKTFKDDIGFLYVAHLAARGLELNISAQILKELISEHFTCAGISPEDIFGRFHIDRMWQEEGVYHIPYTRKDDPSRAQVLKYFIPEKGKEINFPENVLLRVGDTAVVLDDPEADPETIRHNNSYANIDADINQYKRIGVIDPRQPSRGIKRLGYTKSETEAHFQLIKKMKELGMKVWIDEFGNTYGRYESGECDPRAPPLRMISHLDSVPEGGNYDGVAGVLTGLEVIRRIHQHEDPVTRPVELVAYRCEESSRFGKALIGSTLATDTSEETRRKLLLLKDSRNITLEEAIRAEKYKIKSSVETILGFSLEERKDITPVSELEAVYEIHAEQGNKLFNDARAKIAIADGIAAPVRFKVKVDPIEEPDEPLPSEEELTYLLVSGQKDHSGATPMLTDKAAPARKDALCAAAEIASSLERRLGRDDLVYGIYIQNPSINTIPGKVVLAVRHHGKRNALDSVISSFKEKRQGDFRIKKVIPDLVEEDFGQDPVPRNHPRTFMAMLKLAAALESAACDISENIITALASDPSSPFKENALPVGTMGECGLNDNGDLSFSIDIRGYNTTSRRQLVEDFLRRAADIVSSYAEHAGIQDPFEWEDTSGKKPVDTDASLRGSLLEAAKKLNIPCRVFHSGAGHDLMNFWKTAIALLFVPSEEGISHNPMETTDTEHLVNAAEILHGHIKDEFSASEVEKSGNRARKFIDRLKLRLDALKRGPSSRERHLIIGFETDWISSLRETEDPRFKQAAQELLNFIENELPRLLEEKGLDNVSIIRSRADSLVSEIESEVEKTGASLSNVIALGSNKTMDSPEFDRIAGLSLSEKALLVGIDPSRLIDMPGNADNIDEHVFVNFVEMMNAALALHKNYDNYRELVTTTLGITVKEENGRRVFIFIPRAEACDYRAIRLRYRAQIKAMTSA